MSKQDSKREWQPGDVALVRCEDGLTHRAIVVNAAYPGGLHVVVPTYALAHDMGANQRIYFGEGAIRRPADIDPEDREQVERLLMAYLAQRATLNGNAQLGDLQAALREFADPRIPKPDEPTGLGAVVEDVHGRRYQRVDRERAAWLRSDIPMEAALDWRDYTEVAAVRVLSEGVVR